MKTVALLLDDANNRYQQLLARQARAHTPRQELRLLRPVFAQGSSWTQIETINKYLRSASPPDALLIMPSGEQHTGSWLERALGKNLAVVLLNRIPDWINIGNKFPNALAAGVAPRQVEVGQLQAQQALRIVRPGAFVLLVTGAAKSQTAIERRTGFLDSIGKRLNVTLVDGRWTPEEAEKAMAEWLKVGAERNRSIDLVVCQNDNMAVGVRRALLYHARLLRRPELANTPLIGCDGLEEEGQTMVRGGSLVATVVLPATTPVALDVLHQYWTHGTRPGTVGLEVSSYPALDEIRRP